MAKIGYARTSATGQSLSLQLMRLEAFGCTAPEGLIFVEEQNIPEVEARVKLKSCLEHIRKGDVLVVTKLDRLARAPEKIAEINNDLNKRGAGLYVIDEEINTQTLKGKWLLKYCLLTKKF